MFRFIIITIRYSAFLLDCKPIIAKLIAYFKAIIAVARDKYRSIIGWLCKNIKAIEAVGATCGAGSMTRRPRGQEPTRYRRPKAEQRYLKWL